MPKMVRILNESAMNICQSHLLLLCMLMFAMASARPSNAEELLTSSIDDMQSVSSLDWPWWRGPFRDGSAFPDQDPPTTWSETENVIWKTAVPGRGHSSPVVVGDHIYLATADRERDLQSVLCYDRANGKLNWEAVVHRGGLMKKNKKASQASSSVAWDGERVIVSFPNNKAIYTTALDNNGKQLWQAKVSDYVIHQGYAASPNVYQHLVIVNADNKGGGSIVAMDRSNGDIVWQHARPKLPNYPSPVIVHVNGKDQMIMIGGKLVTSLNPLNGELIWEVDGSTEECVTSTVTDGVHIYSSGGWPDNHVAAIKADGSGEIVWQNKSRVYVPSMLMIDGYLFAVLDAGVATCWKSDTGEQTWKSRLGGNFSSSPVRVGDLIYATNEVGETFVYKASPKKFDLVSENKLGDNVFATPAIVGGRIYTRIAMDEDDKRQEYLYCLGDN